MTQRYATSRRGKFHAAVLGLVAMAGLLFLLQAADRPAGREEQLARHRNLGKAFYENGNMHAQSVAEFRKALDLAPDSARERINYALALLRAGKMQDGTAELEKAQKQDPSIPHTWFNLGITFKKEAQYERAIEQLEGMARLVPDEPITQYNLGVLYRMTGKPDQALEKFKLAAKIDPNLAGPRFQLYTAYKLAGNEADAEREYKVFQDIKRRQTGSATPEDLEWSFYAEVYDVVDPAPAVDDPASLPAPEFRATRVAPESESPLAGLELMDCDGDGRTDLVAWSAAGVKIYKQGTTPVEKTGLEDVKEVLSVAAGDFNNNGLADLAVVTKAGAALYTNEKGSFRKAAATLPAGSFQAAAWLDYDHDGDLDLVLLGEKPALLRNNGPAGFSDDTASFPFVPGKAVAATLYQQMPDSDEMDLVVRYSDRTAVVYRDRLAGKFEAQPLEDVPAGTLPLAVGDLDNDGWIDLVAPAPGGAVVLLNKRGKLERASDAIATGAGSLVLADLLNRGRTDVVSSAGVFWNRGQGAFAPARSASIPPAVAIAAADFDADGQTDLAVAASDGSLQFLKNQTATSNRSFSVNLTGVKSMRMAPGAILEVKAGTLYQKHLYRGVPLLVGVGTSAAIDTIRITWPNGLVQNELNQQPGSLRAFKEAPRLSGSCPMVFAWNGREFEFITDVLGVAPLGASAGDGQYFPVNHREYIRISGDSLAPRDGQYELRITEELREVSYLDQIQLIAVDHPADTEVVTNDKFKGPPFPEFRLYGVRERIHAKRARDHRGRDVLDLVLRRDARYPDQFERNYAGVAEMHSIELDFGKAAPGNRAVLVLSGWVDWADGSTFRAMSQESKEGLVLPYLQVKDAAGKWVTVLDDMGIPAGKPKTIAVDLTGKFLSASREVRIVTNLCAYWDEIFLTTDTAAPEATLTPLSASTADLRFRGFSRPVVHADRKQPESFVYAEVSATSNWNPTPGLYTRFGDVRPLLHGEDDRLVIMGSGDELRLLFNARALPPVKPGWRRNFLLMVDGWAKDADANTAFAKTVEPLPFHGMTSYPYPRGEKFPDTAEHRRYLEQYNTRSALRLLRPLNEGVVRAGRSPLPTGALTWPVDSNSKGK